MSVESTAAGIRNISNNLRGENLQAQRSFVEYMSNMMKKMAKAIAAREFMYKLRGDNDQIDLESIATLRDGGAKELSKSA